MFGSRRRAPVAATYDTYEEPAPFGTTTRRAPRRGLFGRRTAATTTTGTTATGHRKRGFFSRHAVNPDRRAAGLKSSLANPNTTHAGRQEAKEELHAMGRSAHVPLSTKIKRTLGIRSTPRRQRRAKRTIV